MLATLKRWPPMDRLLFIIAAVCLTLAFVGLGANLAHAADAVATATPTTTTVPWGDWLVQLLTYFKEAIGLALLALSAWVMARLPAALVPFVKTLLTEQLINRAVDYALGAVEGAVKGKTLDLTTSNAVIAMAEQYAVTSGSKLVLSWIDGTLRPKIVARLSAAGALPDTAHADNLGAALPSTQPAA